VALSLGRDLSLSAVVAGFVAVLVGFSSSAVFVFEAARVLGANAAQSASWLWALGVGMALTSIVLSLRYRMPIITAWSTPAAALLITSSSGVHLAEAVGAFVLSGLLVCVAGFSGGFERVMRRVPMSLASAMLAGILLRFGMDVFVSMQQQFGLVFGMFMAYVLMRRLAPRYAVPMALLGGLLWAGVQGQLHLAAIHWQLTMPVWVTPQFSPAVLVGVALPMFVVTMASQNMAGVVAMQASGYRPPISPVIGWTGVATTVLAPFGAFSINLAAITAAICMGPEAHEDPQRRYVSAISAGLFYLLLGLFSATVTAVFWALPHALVLALAGLALFGTIGNGLAAALERSDEREAALVTFLVTASNMSLFGVGSAFWGLVAGGLVFAVGRVKWR
jgi:benzoate membrane transport protein